MVNYSKHETRETFPPLLVTHVLAQDGTHSNKYLLSVQNFVSGLIDNLLSINEYFFFVSCAVTVDKVPF